MGGHTPPSFYPLNWVLPTTIKIPLSLRSELLVCVCVCVFVSPSDGQETGEFISRLCSSPMRVTGCHEFCAPRMYISTLSNCVVSAPDCLPVVACLVD